MAIEFNGSKKNREMEALDLLLKGKSDEYKGRVLEYVRNAKVDADDSTFLLMAALGNLDVALVDLPKEIEERDLVVLWDFNNWRAQHWLFAIGTSVIITVVAIDSWRTHSKLNQVMEELRSTNEKIADMSEKVGYNTTKLGRIEKYLGIKRTK